MKTFMLNHRSNSRPERGSVLLIALLVAAILIPLIWSTVYMASVQQRTVSLAQSWNATVPALEAGIEEAFAHLNNDCLIEANAQWGGGFNGWTDNAAATSGEYYFSAPRRSFPDGSYYDVSIYTNGGGASSQNPSIVCVASMSARFGLRSFTNASLLILSTGPQFATVNTVNSSTSLEVDRGTNTFIKRQVRVTTMRSSWANFGLLGFNGVGIAGTVRSFDSAGASSFWGSYLPSLADDEAVVGSLHSDITFHSGSQVYGNLKTSPDGSVGTGGTVGDENWVNNNNSGIQPGHYDNDLDLPDPEIPATPSVSQMQLWSTLSACSPKCNETYTLPSLTNGAWITTTDCPPNALTGFMMPPGGTILTNTNGTTTSFTYYSGGTPPGPPIATNLVGLLVTNTTSSLTNIPTGAMIVATNFSNPTWATNWATSQSSPAQSPVAGTYLTSPVGSPSGYNSASAGVFVFLQSTNYSMPNCCTAFPATNDFYSGTMTGVQGAQTPACCTTPAVATNNTPQNVTNITSSTATNVTANNTTNYTYTYSTNTVVSGCRTNGSGRVTGCVTNNTVTTTGTNANVMVTYSTNSVTSYTTNITTSVVPVYTTNYAVRYVTNFTYSHIRRKVYQVPGGTNYSYATGGSNTYVYRATTYSYYGPQTNNLTVNEDYTYVARGGDHQINSISLSGQSKMLITGGANRIYVPNGLSLGGNAKIVIAPGSTVEFYMGGDVTIGGNGFANTDDKAASMMIYGLPTCTNIKLHGNGKFTGVILAPNADMEFKGGGSRGLAVGAITVKSISSSGSHAIDFVYDQDVRRHVTAYFSATKWSEEDIGYVAP